MPSSEPRPARDVPAALTAAAERSVAAGERWTPPRDRVLQLLLETRGPVRAYDLVAAFAPGAYTHPPTVYRALDFLAAHGFAHHLKSVNRFVACAAPWGAHDAQFLICDGCGSVAERPFELAPALTGLAAAHGFVARSWVVELQGRCPACNCASG